MGSHSITATYSGDNTYESSSASAIPLSVTPAILTITGVTAVGKAYDGGTSATLQTAGAILHGVVSPDVISLDFAGATGTFSDKNVGTKTVTVAGITFSGAGFSNYTLVQPATTADISPKGLTVTGITAIDKTYDGKANADLNTSAAALSGVVGNESVTLHANGTVSGTFADKNAGTDKPVIVTGIFITGQDVGNYTVAQPTSLTANIAKAGQTITWSNPADIVYGTALSLTQLNATVAGVRHVNRPIRPHSDSTWLI